jgi:hypothetical protein
MVKKQSAHHTLNNPATGSNFENGRPLSHHNEQVDSTGYASSLYSGDAWFNFQSEHQLS